jgi:hypothetical protein
MGATLGCVVAKPTELMLEIDGPDLHPTTGDPLLLLRLAESWFRFTAKVASGSGHRLTLRGIAVRDKCVAFATVPSNVRVARLVAGQAARIINGAEDAPIGADGALDDVRRNVRGLATECEVLVRVGDWTKTLTPPTPAGPTDRWERTELRVRPVRVGGTETITAKLISRSESVAFTVTVPVEDHARILGANLYRDVDVELRLCRGPDDIVKTGEVIDVHALDVGDEGNSWLAWFKENAGEWADVDNVLEELGRGH